ncbi:hypothetical protein J14TS2_24220 [Bacillus sp. J14TS2]|uniref:hypothetical protein n=1 Tax=Bacillus sp. J14TS2 TaxID=2807188 RepID=UPI001B232209|nr:hypothetical protein [Bacillus sp. J14TS2]GIN71947.1 hypothetical protein J14TS2_24220 [Bacillus sp. J14TS2]
MNKSLTLGIAISLISLITGFLTNNWFLAVKITGMTAIVSILLAGIFMGAPIRHQENKWIKNLVFIAIPNFILLTILISIRTFISF